jgi:leucyl/phenylalanyl-tRNA---protein transferase
MSARFGPDELIACYRRGVFPMAESRDASELFLVDPDWRGVLPLERFHVPRRLRRSLRTTPLRVVANQDFVGVVRACAESRPGREETWINPSIVSLYEALHKRGQAHSVEVRDGEDALVGGLYGVALGAAFFGESMFSRVTDASKIALCHLAARLRLGDFHLLDAQFWTKHLDQFGMEQMPRWRFKRELEKALAGGADFNRADAMLTGDQVLQSIAQIS